MAKAKKTIDMTALAVEGAVVTINGVERDTYCAEVGTQITWSVAKEGYATQSGSFILREDTTLNVVLGLDGFHFTYDNDTMTILKGTEAASANTAGVFCIDGLWDIMINGTVLYAEGGEGDVTYGSEYLKSEGNDIIVLPREGAKIYRRYASLYNSGISQAANISDVISWGSCEYGAMGHFFSTTSRALLKSIPAFTEGFKNVTSFSECFYGCTGLTSLPENLFANCTAVTTFSYCFYGCTGLTSLPENLFANCTAVTDFYYCFYQCTGLTGAIPEGLFDACTAVTDFSCCFYSCSGLTSLPSDLFANCTKVTTFSCCFYSCSGLTSLPENLFAGCTAVTNFSYCFYGCTGLTSLPENLFANCTKVTNFSYCFSSGPSSTHNLTGESAYDLVTIDGVETIIHLYERENYPDIYTKPSTTSYCYRYQTKLDDYDSIPDGWK